MSSSLPGKYGPGRALGGGPRPDGAPDGSAVRIAAAGLTVYAEMSRTA
ncbi:hypothetical protein AB0L10_16135 [Streptomyces flaveolus]